MEAHARTDSVSSVCHESQLTCACSNDVLSIFQNARLTTAQRVLESRFALETSSFGERVIVLVLQHNGDFGVRVARGKDDDAVARRRDAGSGAGACHCLSKKDKDGYAWE